MLDFNFYLIILSTSQRVYTDDFDFTVILKANFGLEAMQEASFIHIILLKMVWQRSCVRYHWEDNNIAKCISYIIG